MRSPLVNFRFQNKISEIILQACVQREREGEVESVADAERRRERIPFDSALPALAPVHGLHHSIMPEVTRLESRLA